MAVALETQAKALTPEHGFSVSEGADWSKYAAYRPTYPHSFFKHIYDYHASKPQAAWSRAHDVGAGAGIVSATLATGFGHLVVSDPNDGYTVLARRILVEELHIPEAKLEFLQEPAEKSSVESGVVDLITACEMIQWTDTDAAVRDFHRQLQPGGTLAVTSYTRPRIVGNERAQRAWQAIFSAYSKKTRGLGDLYDSAFKTINSALENVALPETHWTGVRRIYINAGGSVESFRIDERVGESRVGKGEEKIWKDEDEDWTDVKNIAWFKAYFATWVPHTPEHEIQGLWDDLESSLNGGDVKIETPIVLVFATKA
ncbi:hypothetical protein F5Y14DRAFT_423002 [Nemania sp. NC0429]|nr:hypothetical protein F5Y14DRAFT_423002 [Nemania sp. NC0429]